MHHRTQCSLLTSALVLALAGCVVVQPQAPGSYLRPRLRLPGQRQRCLNLLPERLQTLQLRPWSIAQRQPLF